MGKMASGQAGGNFNDISLNEGAIQIYSKRFIIEDLCVTSGYLGHA